MMKITFRKKCGRESSEAEYCMATEVWGKRGLIGMLTSYSPPDWTVWTFEPERFMADGKCWSRVAGSFASEQDARAMILKVIAADVSRAEVEP